MNENTTNNRIFGGVSSQVSLAVHGDGIFRTLQERVMKWAFDPKRNVRNIPDGAWEGKSFEIDSDNSERVEAVALDNPKYWAFRLIERLKDSSRIWTTEVGIAERSTNEVAFGCRVICAQRGNAEPIPRSVPAFVRGIAFAENATLDGRPTSSNAWIVNDRATVTDLVSFLVSKDRKHPVVVFSVPEGSEDPNRTAVPVDPFIRSTAGFVHSVVMTSKASFELTDQITSEFSVFRQAIRTYNPGFDPNDDLWSDHPLATADRVRGWHGDDQQTFIDFLVHQTLRRARPRDVLEQEQPPFQKVKAIAAQQARAKAQHEGQSLAELLVLTEEELEAAKQDAADNLELAVAAEDEKEQAIVETRQIKANYMALQARVESLQRRLEASGKHDVVIPTELDGIGLWAEENLSGDVELHDRALKAVSKSGFEDVELVYNALLMMRDLYVPMRRVGGNKKVGAFETRLAELGLQNAQCFNQKNKAKNFGGDYFVRYQGNNRELEWHLKGRNSRDERHGFRLYYFWDAETSRVVVGHLPGHLRTDIT